MKLTIALLALALNAGAATHTNLPPGWKLQSASTGEWRWVDANGGTWLDCPTRQKAIDNAWEHYEYKTPTWQDVDVTGTFHTNKTQCPATRKKTMKTVEEIQSELDEAKADRDAWRADAENLVRALENSQFGQAECAEALARHAELMKGNDQ